MKKILFSLILFSFVFSALNVNGSTGYVVMPSADGLRAQEFALGMNAYSHSEDIHSHWKYLGGIGTSEGMEISACGRSEREGVFVNLKWFGELTNYENPLMVGMGFENLSSLGTYGDYPNLYMVMTKKFLSGTSFSLGSVGRYINKEMRVSMMAGSEIFFSSDLSFLIDFVSFQDDRYNTNAGFRYYTAESSYFSFLVINASKNSLEGDPAEVEDNPTYDNTNTTIATIGYTINGFL